jgi:oligo-alginate lyase
MNKIKLTLVLFVTAICWSKVLHAQAQKAHPYLFYTAERMKQVKERIKTDTMLAHVWEDMKARADKMVSDAKGGNIELLTLVYTMTGDKQYAEKAKTGLLQLLGRPAWDGMDDRTPRWNSGLGTARGCFTSAVVFDGIYNYLSKEERKKIAKDIVRLGIEPALNDWLSDNKRIHSLNSMGHNWWSAVVFEAGIASLAIMNEVPEAKGWADDVLQASKEWFGFAGSVLENKPGNFDPDGGFYESVSYANFGVSEYLFFRLAWTNALGAIKMPYDGLLEKTVDWFINACYPTSEGHLLSLNFGDSNPFASGDRPAKLMIALGMGKERYWWYLQQTKNNQFREDLNVHTPLGFLYHPIQKTPSAVPDLPLSAIYKDMGWGMLRSSWNKDATLLGVKSGFTWNHAHADAGSFILYHKGRNLLIDGGNVGYGMPEYSRYFVRSEAHNVLLFNGKAQDPQDQYHAVKTPGKLYNLVDGGDVKYILADATGPTAQNFLRNYRNFLWIGNVILIMDDVKTYEAGKFDWLLHVEKEARKKGPDLEITNDSAAILFRPLFPETLPTGYPHDFPEKMKVEERTGMKDHDPKSKLTYYAISPAEPSRVTKFINAIILLNDQHKPVETFTGSSGASGGAGRTNLPRIEKLEGPNMIGVRIYQDGKVTDVYMNLLADGRLMHRNSNNVINGWETDAYIMAVTFPENADRENPDNATGYFISNGSYIRKSDKVVLHSLSKVFMYAAKESEKMNVVLQGQPLIRASLRMLQKPQQLTLNSRKIQPVYSNEKKLVMLEVEGVLR